MAVRAPLLPQVLRRPTLALWCCYLALIPIYYFRAGVPQPSNVLLVLLIPLALAVWNGRLGRGTVRIYRALLWFTLWVIAVDVFWALALWSTGKNLFFPFYYIFNAILFLVALVLHQRHRELFLAATERTVFWLIIGQVAVSFFYRGDWGATRSSIFFDNPNQLGYYALLSACVLTLMHRPLRLGMVRTSIGLLGCGYLAVISASRSAAAGIAMLVALLIISNPRVIIIAALVAGTLTLFSSVETSFDSLEERVAENRHPNLSFFEQRGYDRIYNNPKHLMFGASEGNNRRFIESTKIGMVEIHSSAGTILFCYGMIGTILFGAFWWRLLHGVPIRVALILVPPLLYTVAHQGLRFSMLWVLLALFVALKEKPPVPATV